jgi:hypothetical protein
MKTPDYYAGKVTPWDLEKCMQSSGSAFVDSRRTDAIEYVYRIKDNLLEDLHKARHCLDEAIEVMEAKPKVSAASLGGLYFDHGVLKSSGEHCSTSLGTQKG